MTQSDETTIRLKSTDSLKLYIDERGPIELSGKTLGNCIDSFMAQSDAPNEGREETQLEQDAKEYLLKQGTHDRPDITRHDFKQGWQCGYNYLRDQLSKERETVRQLEVWKKGQIDLWLPVIEYMQSNKELKPGDSISEITLNVLKHHYEGINAKKLNYYS